ncbi:unnamed protein product [Adineta steineri]|uniref:Uncharacterized protein n=1 Tax=Adineta steineri TaxID=433720 RepID=A0A819ZT18_9BILA|nr:unnamed protein product [Adineta steineri]CAF4182345.1 unnamed protein product [Adineta steineri]
MSTSTTSNSTASMGATSTSTASPSTTSTSTTSPSTTSTSTTSPSTTSTSMTSTSSRTTSTSTSTISQTTTTTKSTTSTSTSTSKISTTTTTSVTTSTSATTTTQNPIFASLSDSSLIADQWILFTRSYLAAISANLSLQFTFAPGNKYNWYLDDISIKDPTSGEMLTNGNLEASPTLTGWSTSGSGGAISSAQSHSSNHSFYATSNTPSISQSFAAIGGQVYNVTFWLYLDDSKATGSSGGTPTVVVTMN